MDFSLTEEQTQFRDSVRGFAARELAPHAARACSMSGFPIEKR